jgi:tetratricopeptide (TPR) repeat protein
VPLAWAGTQNNLGLALKSLGERESGTARLEQAVAAYDEALKEYTRERAPLQWASSQHGLATTLAALAERRKSAKTMEQALTCMRGAAEVYQESNNAYWLPIANPASPRWKLSW